ncbi:hypothetical protein M408DRAFT_10916 [Serendipita vermifera MAFF 305830]|uniref:Uncharacterized protein n=1 Tax=Serendipita vermifera MAFF 305830 TaxID=933852 RepID=A0A0C3AJ54_SERVB|nr:hypothetical protein M408DRAFT_10916 [Serendipita vermifera MAFF 305830]
MEFLGSGIVMFKMKLRQAALDRVKRQVDEAVNYETTKHSQQRLRESIRQVKEADLRFEAAEEKVQDSIFDMQAMYSNSYLHGNECTRLPERDLDYRRKLVELNRFKEEMTVLCQPLAHSSRDSYLLDSHHTFIDIVKNALSTSVHEASDIVAKANAAIKSIPEIRASESTAEISDLRDKEENRPEFALALYVNPFTTKVTSSPIWGIPGKIVTDTEGRSVELRFWMAQYYVKRLRIVYQSEGSHEDSGLSSQAVVPLAFDLETRFSRESLEMELDRLKLNDVKSFLEFALSNQPTPVLELDEATFSRCKLKTRPGLMAALIRQTSENKKLLRFLCENWGESHLGRHRTKVGFRQ